MDTCIQIFAYNRPYHLEKALVALSVIDSFSKYEVFINVDGFKDESDKVKNRLTIEICERYSKLYENIKYQTSTKNFGLSSAIISGLNSRFKVFEKVIILEDDIVVSNEFLDYMQHNLDNHSNNPEIGSITSHNEGYFPFWLKNDFVALKRHSCWGWATWRDRWQQIHWDICKESDDVFMEYQEALEKIGYDLKNFLVLTRGNNLDSWAIIWDANMARMQMRSIHPRYSISKNIGFDGSGTNFSLDLNRRQVSGYSFTKNTDSGKYSVSDAYDAILKISHSKPYLKFKQFLEYLRYRRIFQ